MVHNLYCRSVFQVQHRVSRGYDVLLVSDAHTTEDLTEWGAPPPDQVIAPTNLYWTPHTAPGRSTGTAKTAWVDFAGG